VLLQRERFLRRRIESLANRLRKSFFIFVLSSFLIPASGGVSQAGTLEAIQTKIAQFLKRPGVRSASWGIQIMDPADSKVLLEVNPDKTFLPASVLKVITTSTALEKLGPEFRFRTGVYTDGEIDADGTLTGDLILVGRGDPNLMDPYGELLEKPALVELAEKLQEMGVKKIHGDMIGDDSYFNIQSYGKGWAARDLRSLYDAPVNALSINNNVFWVHIRPTKTNQRVSVSVEPQTSYFRIRNLGMTGSARSKRSIGIRQVPGTNTIVVSGTLPSRGAHSQYILLQKPSETAAAMFQEELERHGIKIKGAIRTIHRGDLSDTVRQSWTLLAEHQSLPLFRTLQIINKHSQNLHAEMLLRTLGAEFKGDGDNEAGLQVVKEFLVESGIDSEKIRLNDGCGLSRENLITPRFQTSLLQFLSTRSYFDLFFNTLAISGTDGTLRNRLAETEVRGNIHAKTGTLNGVTALSGYMTTKSGRNLVFSIFANNVNATARVKKTIDQICSLFVNLY
jgi:serine-type D-Ala-D-Ala carboxypeptidase/endopeptidase (penicillin-binding protein 4)